MSRCAPRTAAPAASRVGGGGLCSHVPQHRAEPLPANGRYALRHGPGHSTGNRGSEVRTRPLPPAWHSKASNGSCREPTRFEMLHHCHRRHCTCPGPGLLSAQLALSTWGHARGAAPCPFHRGGGRSPGAQGFLTRAPLHFAGHVGGGSGAGGLADSRTDFRSRAHGPGSLSNAV